MFHPEPPIGTSPDVGAGTSNDQSETTLSPGSLGQLGLPLTGGLGGGGGLLGGGLLGGGLLGGGLLGGGLPGDGLLGGGLFGGALPDGGAAPFETVTVTFAAVATLPAASRASAVSV
jgi:hypothetical protein